MKASFEFKSTQELISLLNYGSMEEILSWAQEGWAPGIETINELLGEMSLNIEFKQDVAPAVQGLFFDIGLVCSDIPEHWFTPQPINQGVFNEYEPLEGEPPIQIGINVKGLLTHSSVAERGAAIVVLVMYLTEKLKRSVTLKQFHSIENLNNSFNGILTVKGHEEQVDLNALSFWLCCPYIINCWSRIIEDTSCLRDLAGPNPKRASHSNMQYGADTVDIFVTTNCEQETWTREDSKNWIASVLRSYGVKC